MAGRTKRGRSGSEMVHAALTRLQKDLPPGLSRSVRNLDRRIAEVEARVDRARTENEERWKTLENGLRRQLATGLRKLGNSVAP